MKLSDLGNLVKQKYQEYSQVDPVEVGQRVVNKFPTYRQQVTDFSEQVMHAPVRLASEIYNPQTTAGKVLGAPARFLASQPHQAIVSRPAAEIVLSGAELISGNRQTLTPQGVGAQSILGKSPLKSYQHQADTGGVDTLTEYGVNPATAQKMAPYMAVAGVGLDLVPPGVDDVVEKGAKELLTNKKVIGVADDVAKAVGKVRSVVDIDPILNTKREISIKDVHGQKAVLPAGEAYTPYLTNDNKVLLKDGDEFLVNKSTYDNVKGQSVKGEAKPFAPELEGLEETVRGKDGRYDPEIYNKYVAELKQKYDPSGRLNMSMLYDKLPQAEKTKFDLMSKSQKAVRNSETKYSQYTLPGGNNYREILIKAPVKTQLPPTEIANLKNRAEEINKIYSHSKLSIEEEQKLLDELKQIRLKVDAGGTPTGTFKSSHWDEPNVISHIRMNDRVTPDGKKVAFMEELQSDWAREARANNIESNIGKLDTISKQLYSKPYNELSDALKKQTVSDLRLKEMPDHPLLKNWQEPTIKRALKDAVDNDAEYFAWINGDQTSARYNLATYVDDVRWNPSQIGGKTVKLSPKAGSSEIGITLDKDGSIIGSSQGDWTGKKLDEVLGKGLADKIMGEEKGTLSGEGLKFGGEWANNLYDKQVKSIVEKLTGGKVEVIDLGMNISKKGYTTDLVFGTKNKVTGRLDDITNYNQIKLNQEIYHKGKYWLVTKLLGDGKFEAVDIEKLTPNGNIRANAVKEIFDLDIKPKSPGQQAIRLTPEIKARIRGEAPPIKQPSGKLPNFNQSQLPKRVGLDL